MSPIRRALRTGALSLVATICGFAALEVALRIGVEPVGDGIGGRFETVREAPHPDRIAMRRNLGWYFVDTEIRNWKRDSSGEPIYDVTYRFDPYGRRLTPPPAAEPDRHLLVAGGSFAMGHGLPEVDSLPARLQVQLPKTRVYNYATSGYAPAQLLRLLELKDLRSEVAEPRGTMLYLYIDDHLQRILVSSRVAAWSRGNLPTYQWRADDQLIYGGVFRNVSPLKSKVYGWIGESRFLQRIGFDPPFVSEEHAVRLGARMIAEVAGRYRDQFPSGDFYVVFFPRHDRTKSALIPELDRREIAHIDLEMDEGAFPSSLFFREDLHPNAEGIAVVAEQLGPRLRTIEAAQR